MTTERTTLPNDYARCDGHIATAPSTFGSITAGRAECVRCLRRTAPRPERFSMFAPPEFQDGKCPQRIAP